MATLRDIKRRIKAVKNTQQITKAMKMVAASKLRKAQQRMLELRPYAAKMSSVIKGLACGSLSEAHPLLTPRPRKAAEIVVLTSDKGLCGAFNSNVLKATMKQLACLERLECEERISSEGVAVTVSAVGRKAVDFLKRRKVAIRKTWAGAGSVSGFSYAQKIASELVEQYVSGAIDEVYIVYNEFGSVARQEVRVVKLLPTTANAGGGPAADSGHGEHLFEPEQDMLLDALLPKNIEVQVYRALLESQASEEAARMTAMENATKAASDMIGSLTLVYNKARQASITGELMDIVGGVEALKE